MLAQLADNALGLAEIGANRLLQLDDHVLQHCTKLQSSCIEIHLSDINQRIYCHPGSWGIRLSLQKPAKNVDATISGRIMALVALSLEQDKISTSIQQRVEISGDAAVAQQFQKIMTELDIDWEEVLSQYTGDILAYKINLQFKRSQQWFAQSLQSLMRNSSEYMQHESRSTPSLPEYQRFQANLGTLRSDIDRAEARIRQLTQKLSAKSS